MSSPAALAPLNALERLRARALSGSPKAFDLLARAARAGDPAAFRNALIAGATLDKPHLWAEALLLVANAPNGSLAMFQLLNAQGVDVASALIGHPQQWVSRPQYAFELAAAAGNIEASLFLAKKTLARLDSLPRFSSSDFDDPTGWHKSAVFTAVHIAKWAGETCARAIESLPAYHADTAITENSQLVMNAFRALRLQKNSLSWARETLSEVGSASYQPPLIQAVPSQMALSLLLSHGAVPNESCALGNTALHKAGSLLHAQSVQTLLAAGANPNAIDANGQTPLQAAAEALERFPAAPNPNAMRAEEARIAYQDATAACQALLVAGALAGPERSIITDRLMGAVRFPEQSAPPPAIPEAPETPETNASSRVKRRIGAKAPGAR